MGPIVLTPAEKRLIRDVRQLNGEAILHLNMTVELLAKDQICRRQSPAPRLRLVHSSTGRTAVVPNGECLPAVKKKAPKLPA